MNGSIERLSPAGDDGDHWNFETDSREDNKL